MRATCKNDGCGKPSHAHGLCATCYVRLRRRSEVPAGRLCCVEGCMGAHAGRGYCESHYARLRRTGSPYGRRALPQPDLIRLRRAVGLPDDGPTAAMVDHWNRLEARA